MEFPNRRVLLSKTMAKAEFQQKMNNMKLPKVEQEHFFRRYDFFEKKAFKTMNDFRKTKNSKSANTLFSTFESEFNKPKKADIYAGFGRLHPGRLQAKRVEFPDTEGEPGLSVDVCERADRHDHSSVKVDVAGRPARAGEAGLQ
jgi:hypothetical protein